MYIIHTLFQLNKIFQVFDGVIVYLNIILISITHTNTWYTCMNNFFFYIMHKRIKLFIIIIYCFLYFFSNLNLNSMCTHSKTICVWHMLWWFVDKCCICIHKRITISIFRFFFFSAKTFKTWPKKWMPNKPSLACIYSIFY